MFPKMMGTERFVWFMAKVENVMDPDNLGRVQARMYGLHEDDQNELPTEDLPWATVALPTTAAGVNGIGVTHGLRPGSDVWGFLADGLAGQLLIICGVISAASEGPANTLAGANGPAGAGVNAEPSPLDASTIQTDSTTNKLVTPSEKIETEISTELGNTPNDNSFAPQVGPGQLGSLTSNQVKAYKAWLGQAESRSQYGIENTAGFLGKYQFGALGLIEVGLVKSSSIPRNISDVAQNKLLNNPAVWTGKWNINSKSDFLNKGVSQELAQDALMQVQYRYAVSFGCVNSSSPPGAVAGYIAACHIGLHAMLAIKKGSDVRDGYGTSAKGRFVTAKKVVESVS